jgi:hypothetical protein
MILYGFFSPKLFYVQKNIKNVENYKILKNYKNNALLIPNIVV